MLLFRPVANSGAAARSMMLLLLPMLTMIPGIKAADNNNFVEYTADPNCVLENLLIQPDCYRWYFTNTVKLLTNDIISKGTADDDDIVPPLSTCHGYESEIGALTIEDSKILGGPITIDQLLNDIPGIDGKTSADGFLVLWQGEVVYEKYFHDDDNNGNVQFTRNHRHLLYSCTKSYIGLVAAMLIDEGRLDPDHLAMAFVPDLKGTAFADATVRQLLDMTVSVNYTEEYTDPTSDVFLSQIGTGTLPIPTSQYTGPTNTRSFITSLRHKNATFQNDDLFYYVTTISDLLGWIVNQVLGGANAASSRYLSQNVWSKLGMDHDAMIAIDRTHFPAWGSLFQTTARDAARFGQMMIQFGQNANGQSVVPPSVVQDILNGGTAQNVEQFAKSTESSLLSGWAYRNQFRVKPGHVVMQWGLFGQWVWMDYQADLVIVKFSTAAEPWDTTYAQDHFAAFSALGEYFANKMERGEPKVCANQPPAPGGKKEGKKTKKKRKKKPKRDN